ncbi:hypothetical protein ILUMI_00962 [Ignelater luminosus]|uniref:CLIP domain-containing serine protease n=1 Tax=Ignelater luminosus TaxID=2038154 RepID=A0A8K0DLA0_IGNLU|nr:hypothetical protein ILUMI_00962 [Ignelater luminosus]
MNRQSTLFYLNVCLFLVIFIKASIAETDEDCVTPNGETAKCVSLPNCPVMLEALRTKDDESINFIRSSHCGFVGKIPLVCCGNQILSEINPVDKLIDDYYKTMNTSTVTQEPNSDYEQEEEEQNPNAISLDSDTNQFQDRSVCGLEQHESHTQDEHETDLHESPWTVVLEYQDKIDGQNMGIKCVGVIINKRYILTTASCIQDRVDIPVSVRLGEWDVTTNPDCRQIGRYGICAASVERIDIAQTISHPYYSKRTESNDIGLIKLAKDIIFTDYIRPICLPSPDVSAPDRDTLMTVIGWGTTQAADSMSNNKTKDTVTYLPIEECKDLLQNKPTRVNMFRACGKKSNADACHESLGGPVMMRYPQSTGKQNQWYLEGLVANECIPKGDPVVYTRVSRYMNWITQTVQGK